MARNTEKESRPAEETKPQPLLVYVVDDSEKTKKRFPKGLWTRVGVAYPHEDEKGFNIVLAPNVAVSGRMVIRPKKPKDAAGGDDIPADDIPF